MSSFFDTAFPRPAGAMLVSLSVTALSAALMARNVRAHESTAALMLTPTVLLQSRSVALTLLPAFVLCVLAVYRRSHALLAGLSLTSVTLGFFAILYFLGMPQGAHVHWRVLGSLEIGLLVLWSNQLFALAQIAIWAMRAWRR